MTDTLPLGPDELLTTTRSGRTRRDFDRPVPLELVKESIEVALQAPTGSNQQGWHWIVVTDADKRARIGEYYRQSYARYATSPAAAARTAALSEERQAVQGRVRTSSQYLADRMGEVPVHVIACITATDLPAGQQAGPSRSPLPRPSG